MAIAQNENPENRVNPPADPTAADAGQPNQESPQPSLSQVMMSPESDSRAIEQDVPPPTAEVPPGSEASQATPTERPTEGPQLLAAIESGQALRVGIQVLWRDDSPALFDETVRARRAVGDRDKLDQRVQDRDLEIARLQGAATAPQAVPQELAEPAKALDVSNLPQVQALDASLGAGGQVAAMAQGIADVVVSHMASTQIEPLLEVVGAHDGALRRMDGRVSTATATSQAQRDSQDILAALTRDRLEGAGVDLAQDLFSKEMAATAKELGVEVGQIAHVGRLRDAAYAVVRTALVANGYQTVVNPQPTDNGQPLPQQQPTEPTPSAQPQTRPASAAGPGNAVPPQPVTAPQAGPPVFEQPAGSTESVKESLQRLLRGPQG